MFCRGKSTFEDASNRTPSAVTVQWFAVWTQKYFCGGVPSAVTVQWFAVWKSTFGGCLKSQWFAVWTRKVLFEDASYRTLSIRATARNRNRGMLGEISIVATLILPQILLFAVSRWSSVGCVSVVLSNEALSLGVYAVPS